MGLLRFWITLGALIAATGLAILATSPARMSAAVPSDQQPVSAPTATPTVVGVMGVSSRASLQAPLAPQATVCPSGTPLQGIDVSYYQGSFNHNSINWTLVAQSGRSFAYARAADGTTFPDPDFQINYAGIKQVGMKAGAYLFFRPDEDPTAQANVLVAALRQAHFAAGDLAPVFDVEVADGQSGATIVATLQTAITVVRQALGVTPVIYTSYGFWNGSVNSTAFSADPLWTANWNVSCPGVPVGWTSWVVWQYNDTSMVPGIIPVVDGDKSSGGPLPLYNALPPRVFVPFVAR